VRLDAPPPRYAATELKDAPCGTAANGPGDVRTTFESGQTIVVEWTETIDHPGWFRIAFDADGDDGFLDPQYEGDVYNTPEVLLDEIMDGPGGPYSAQVTLPAVVCDTCTLQLLQVMTDKTANGWGNDEVYHQCADLRLVPAGSGTGSGSSTSAGTTEGTTAGTGPGATTSEPTSDAGSGSSGDGALGADAPQGCACTATSTSVPHALALPAVLVLGGRSRRRVRASHREPCTPA
jgi:hypothetical protein